MIITDIAWDSCWQRCKFSPRQVMDVPSRKAVVTVYSVAVRWILGF